MKQYRHHKGGIYEFLYIAIHSETEEKLVIYRNSEGVIYARPYDMFFENVTINGVVMPRFTEIV